MTDNLGTALGIVSISNLSTHSTQLQYTRIHAPIQPSQDPMMRYALLITLGLPRLRRPSLKHRVVILIVANRDILVHVVADRLCFGMQLDEFGMRLCFLLLLGLFKLLLLFEQVVCVFLCLLLGADLLLDGVDLGADLRGVVLCAAVVCFRKSPMVRKYELFVCVCVCVCVLGSGCLVLAFKIGYDLIYYFDGGVALLLGVADFLGCGN